MVHQNWEEAGALVQGHPLLSWETTDSKGLVQKHNVGWSTQLTGMTANQTARRQLHSPYEGKTKIESHLISSRLTGFTIISRKANINT